MRVNVRFVWGARVLGRAGCKGTQPPTQVLGRGSWPYRVYRYQMYNVCGVKSSQHTNNRQPDGSLSKVLRMPAVEEGCGRR